MAKAKQTFSRKTITIKKGKKKKANKKKKRR